MCTASNACQSRQRRPHSFKLARDTLLYMIRPFPPFITPLHVSVTPDPRSLYTRASLFCNRSHKSCGICVVALRQPRSGRSLRARPEAKRGPWPSCPFSSKTRFAILWITPPSRARPRHSSAFHTGSSAFLRPRPARSTSMPMYGPTTGNPRAKPAMVPRKSPNSTTMPYASTRKPMKVHRRRMRARPTKKAAVPLAFCLRAKKRSVFCGPMMMVRPMRKRIYSGGKGKVCVLVVFYGFGGLGRGSREGGGGGAASYIAHGKPAGVASAFACSVVSRGVVRLTWRDQRRASLLR